MRPLLRGICRTASNMTTKPVVRELYRTATNGSGLVLGGSALVATSAVLYSLSQGGASGDVHRRKSTSTTSASGGGAGGESEGGGGGGEEAAEPYECPFCTMIKAGPCRAKFFPFNDCMDRCEKTGEESETACREAFTAMIECVAAHPNEYKKLIEELENTGTGKNKGDGAEARQEKVAQKKVHAEAEAQETEVVAAAVDVSAGTSVAPDAKGGGGDGGDKAGASVKLVGANVVATSVHVPTSEECVAEAIAASVRR